MKCQYQGEISYLGTLNQLINKNEDQISPSLVNKLRNVEQCIVEKEFLHGLDIVRQIIKEYSVRAIPIAKNYKIEKKRVRNN